MRIGLFAHRLAKPDATGIGRYVQELVSALAEAAGPDDQVAVASTPEPQRPTWIPQGVDAHVVRWPRRPVHAAWCLGTGPRLERGLGRLDVVHGLYPFPPIRTSAPQLVTVHDAMPLEHPHWYPPSERWIYRRSISLALRRASRIVVPSKFVARRLTALLGIDPARIAVVQLGVSGTYTRARSPGDGWAACARLGVEPGRFAICVGAVSTRKNLIPVIRAIADPSAAGLPLLIVGPDGYGVERTEAEIARLNHGARVKRTGYLPDEQTAALVRSAAVLIHPALEEGFGLVPLEAMAAGTPVIAARVSSIPEVVGDAAILVDEPTKPRAWADALMEVTGSVERRDALATAGTERAAAFSWQRTARTMLELYRDVARA